MDNDIIVSPGQVYITFYDREYKTSVNIPIIYKEIPLYIAVKLAKAIINKQYKILEATNNKLIVLVDGITSKVNVAGENSYVVEEILR